MSQQILNFFLNLYKYNIESYLFMGVVAYFTLLWVALIFWVSRDSNKRSKSWLFKLFSFALVTVFNIFGLIIYVILRPSQTLEERKIESMELQILEKYKEEKKGQENKKISTKKKLASKTEKTKIKKKKS